MTASYTYDVDVMITFFSAQSAPHQQQPASPVASSPSCTVQNEEQHDRCLSAWENWILQKAKEERDTAEEKLQKQKEIEKKVEQERVERERKKDEAAAKIRAWINEYDASVKQKRRLQLKRDKAEQELKDEKKLELLNKAEEKFQVRIITPSVVIPLLPVIVFRTVNLFVIIMSDILSERAAVRKYWHLTHYNWKPCY